MILMVGYANAAVTNLFPNGSFDSPAGTGAPWVEVFGGGTTTYGYPISGGNPGGYGIMTNSSGWGIWVGGATTPLPLSSLGLVAGGTYTFVMDMKNIAGTGIGKLKIESWAGGAMLSDSGEISAGSRSSSWATYSFPVTLNAGATGIKVVPVAGAASRIGFDNIGVIVPNSPLTVSIVSPVNGAVVAPNFSIEATATVTPGAITNVSFYDGAGLLGNDTTFPYNYAVSAASLGAHALKVVAWDSSGNSVTSSVVNITVSTPPPVPGWQLVWNDEFDGTSVDSAKWNYDIGNGNGGWGNNELQYYTSRPTNVYVSGGFLNIVARKEVPQYNGFDYTSAKLQSQGKFSKTYGRFEFRARLPQGKGYWPALWMMPQDSVYGGWAASGEIDIMENKGRLPTMVSGAIHYGGTWPNNTFAYADYTFPNGGMATDFHVYALEWSTNSLKWYVDGVLFQTRTSWNSTAAPYPAPFNQPFYLIMNLAVGGNFDGNPDGTTVFPGLMQVDYARVYEFVTSIPNAPAGVSVSPGSAKVYLSWDDSPGATGYQVKRGTTSGGPYTTVASPTANNYTDTGVANCATYYYVVSATNSMGASTNSSEQIATLGAYSFAVNSGGSAAGQFVADANVSGGTIGGASTALIDTTGLTAPAPQAVYQAERYGNFTYTFTGLISGASYKVRLHSAETYWTAVGQRRFNVTINGTQVLTNFDIIATAGAANKAVINEFNTVATGGQIVVQYTTVVDNARASGIEIILPSPPPPTAGNNGPIWTGMTLNLTASTVPGATYSWTGPNGFNSTTQNPSILNATTNHSGTFSVTASIGGCASAPSPTTATVNPPANLTIQSLPGSVILSWPVGTLQSTTNITGPWEDVSGAVSPRTNPVAKSQEFYRIRLQ